MFSRRCARARDLDRREGFNLLVKFGSLDLPCFNGMVHSICGGFTNGGAPIFVSL